MPLRPTNAPLVIALWQDTPPPAASAEGVAWALDALEPAAEAAVGGGAHLLVLPELFLGGYRQLSTMAPACALKPDAPELQCVASIAQKNALAIILGFFERGDDGRVYNSALAVDADGAVKSIYRKTHLFGAAETAAFAPGDRLGDVFTLCNGVRCSLLICYDVEFPEVVRSCVLGGASLVVTPTANFFPYSFANETIVRVRAFESHIHVVYSNWSEHKNEDGVHFNGQSVVASPQGEHLLMLKPGDKGLFLSKPLEGLDRGSSAANGREDDYLRDRRPELYRMGAAEARSC
mmetsp:Transcript_12647/g.39869  ORF Transcript_12647/g.39869 Transcript_12647/m.39869 type:complete len:292 (+) Transcript_12647:41-916(+)